MFLHLQSLITFHFFLIPGLGLLVDSLVPALLILVQHSPTPPQWAVGDKDDEDSVVEQRGAAVLLEVDLTDIVGRYARL